MRDRDDAPAAEARAHAFPDVRERGAVGRLCIERQRSGLDTTHVFDVIGKGAAQSWQMDNRAATMAAGEFAFGFAVEWMRKDLGICMDEAARNGAQLPVTELVDGYYARIIERGGRRWDTSSLIHLLSHPD